MENFYTTAWPFLLILKIFGFFSVTFEGLIHMGNIKFKIFDKLNLGVKLAFLTYLLFTDTDDPPTSNKPRLAIIAWNVRIKCSLVLLTASFLYQLMNHEPIIRLLHLLHKIENQVKANKAMNIIYYFDVFRPKC